MRRIPLVSVLLPGAIAVLIAAWSCSDDNAPGADFEIRVETARFHPNVLEVTAGASVRWANWLPKGPNNVRTVTSGLPDSSETQGLLFDATLEGYESGEAFGQTYTYKFNERGTVEYFSRFPSDQPFTGTIIVR